ncbi:thioredoxin family protein [Psychroserpens sp.]|uniref:thioredoxin family protein n=1 Tax=Psychroserpens sp. TaxID=2020870 RepID=UPI00385B0D3C
MKHIFIIILFTITANLSAQINNQDWLTDYKEALKTSNTEKNPVLVFVTDNSSNEIISLLESQFFNSEDFKKISSSFVLLKLNVSSNPYHKRLASHYSKSDVVPALVLIDKNGNTIDKALTQINSSTVSEFLSFLKTKTKY